MFETEKLPQAPAPALPQVTLQLTPFGGVTESFVITAAILAVALVVKLTGGVSAPLAKLMLIEVEGVMLIVAVDDEEGFAVEVAVITTLPAGLPSGIRVGAV